MEFAGTFVVCGELERYTIDNCVLDGETPSLLVVISLVGSNDLEEI